MAAHGPDDAIPDWAARPLTSQATSGSWERGATSLCHEHRRSRGHRTSAPVAASHGRAASPPGRKAGWCASSMTRADRHRRRPVHLVRRTRRGRSWPAGRSRPAGMGSWSGPPTRRTVPASTASRGRGSRSASRSSAGRAGGWRSGSPWSRSSFTVLPGCTVGRREHRLNSRSVQVHSAATRGSPHIAVPSPSHIPLACRAHQSECGRTPPARGRHHKEEPSP